MDLNTKKPILIDITTLEREIEQSNREFELAIAKSRINKRTLLVKIAVPVLITLPLLAIGVFFFADYRLTLDYYFGSFSPVVGGVTAGFISSLCAKFFTWVFFRVVARDTQADIAKIRESEKPIYDNIKKYLNSEINYVGKTHF